MMPPPFGLQNAARAKTPVSRPLAWSGLPSRLAGPSNRPMPLCRFCTRCTHAWPSRCGLWALWALLLCAAGSILDTSDDWRPPNCCLRNAPVADRGSSQLAVVSAWCSRLSRLCRRRRDGSLSLACLRPARGTDCTLTVHPP